MMKLHEFQEAERTPLEIDPKWYTGVITGIKELSTSLEVDLRNAGVMVYEDRKTGDISLQRLFEYQAKTFTRVLEVIRRSNPKAEVKFKRRGA